MNILSHSIVRPSAPLVRKQLPNPVLHIAQVESQLRKLRLTPWWHRDPVRGSGSCEWSWIEILQRDNFRCVFCGTELAKSDRALALRTTDHLIPKRLFQTELEANRGCNLVTACADCNALKADWRPATPLARAWKSRAAYLNAARRHIEAAACARYEKSKAILAKAQEGAPISTWSTERQPIIESDRSDYLASPFARIFGCALHRSDSENEFLLQPVEE